MAVMRKGENHRVRMSELKVGGSYEAASTKRKWKLWSLEGTSALFLNRDVVYDRARQEQNLAWPLEPDGITSMLLSMKGVTLKNLGPDNVTGRRWQNDLLFEMEGSDLPSDMQRQVVIGSDSVRRLTPCTMDDFDPNPDFWSVDPELLDAYQALRKIPPEKIPTLVALANGLNDDLEMEKKLEEVQRSLPVGSIVYLGDLNEKRGYNYGLEIETIIKGEDSWGGQVTARHLQFSGWGMCSGSAADLASGKGKEVGWNDVNGTFVGTPATVVGHVLRRKRSNAKKKMWPDKLKPQAVLVRVVVGKNRTLWVPSGHLTRQADLEQALKQHDITPQDLVRRVRELAGNNPS